MVAREIITDDASFVSYGVSSGQFFSYQDVRAGNNNQRIRVAAPMIPIPNHMNVVSIIFLLSKLDY